MIINNNKIKLLLLITSFSGCSIFDSEGNNECLINNELPTTNVILGDFIYSKFASSGQLEVFKTNLKGDSAFITNAGLRNLTTPQLSPDSSTILALVNPGITDIGWELYLMDSSGTNIRKANENRPVFGDNPVWSPDGKFIAFVNCNACPASSGFSVYIYSIESKEVVKLTDHTLDVSDPSWLPNSQELVFQSLSRIDTTINLYSVSINSGSVRKLTDYRYPFGAGSPKVNPLTGEILFSRITRTENMGWSFEPAYLKADGRFKILDFETTGFTQLHWSSNGRHLLTYGEEMNTDEYGIKMYSYTNQCFQLEGIQGEKGNSIIRDFKEYLNFQWYLNE